MRARRPIHIEVWSLRYPVGEDPEPSRLHLPEAVSRGKSAEDSLDRDPNLGLA